MPLTDTLLARLCAQQSLHGLAEAAQRSPRPSSGAAAGAMSPIPEPGESPFRLAPPLPPPPGVRDLLRAAFGRGPPPPPPPNPNPADAHSMGPAGAAAHDGRAAPRLACLGALEASTASAEAQSVHAEAPAAGVRSACISAS